MFESTSRHRRSRHQSTTTIYIINTTFMASKQAITALAGLAAFASATPCPPTLPIVDLGYVSIPVLSLRGSCTHKIC